MRERSGKIITFYSYKGGTGRTMAISNVAWILASNGCKVLLIDWDLEAPGLHRYLRPFLLDRELVSTPGLIDYVWEAARVGMTDPQDGSKFPSLDDYIVGLDCSFDDEGIIDFIPAGQQDQNYAQRVNTFNWDNFYERLGGGDLLEAERKALRANYDYILIDSRTGVSDTSSICTVHMPDAVVILFTLNRQSITGAAAVANSIRAQRPSDDFKIFPVPTRVEQTEDKRLNAATVYARGVFAPFLCHVQSRPDASDPEQQAQYWNDVETPYRPIYAFEEIPASFNDEPGSVRTVLWASERIAYWITDQTVISLKPGSSELRSEVVKAYAFVVDDDLPRIKWPKPPRRGALTNLGRRIGAWLRRRDWRYATAMLASLLILATVSFGLIYDKWNATLTELNSARAEIGKEEKTIDDLNTTIKEQTAKIGRQSKYIGDLRVKLGLPRSFGAR